jgi:4-hydroxy-tetrahydrodipicolinate synthase
MQSRFSGIIPPIITPMVGRDQLDHAGLSRLIEHLLSGGVHGVYALRREMVVRTIELVRGRVPVLVGITDTSFVETVQLAKHAADCGATALVLSTPYYFPAGQTELRYYVDELMQELPLPVMLYNIPSLTKVAFEIPTLEYLTRHPKIVGLKDSGGDLGYYEQAIGLKKLRPDWSILLGPESLLAESLKLGGDGGVAGGANIFPSLFVQLYQAVRDNDPNWQVLQQRVERLQKIYDVGKYASRFIKATKCGASLLGICDDFLADPFHRFHPEDRAKVEAILKTV